MNKTIFSRSLFLNTLQRLRMPALSMLAVCVSFTILPLLLSTETYRTLDNIALILSLYMYVGPVLLGFLAYSFLLHRRDSDFYLSLPYTRRCLYCSILAAVALCLFTTILCCLTVGTLLMVLLRISFIPSHPALLLCVYFSGSMLVLGALMLALSFTGTYFSAFVLGALFLLLPRAISLVCGLVVESYSSRLSVLGNGLLLNATLNIPFAMLAGIPAFLFGLSELFGFNALADLGSLLYTSLLAAVYLLLGCIGFIRRPSETAERPAKNTLLQHLSRSLLSFPFFLCAICILLFENSSDLFPSIVLLCVCGLLAYFLYELITTRSVRRLLPALYVLPAVLAASFLLPAACRLYVFAAEKQSFPVESIQSVSFLSEGETNYSETLLHGQPLTDEALLSLVSKSLSQDENPAGSAKRSRLRLKNGRQIYRNLFLPTEELQQLYRTIPALVAAQTTLPSDPQILNVSMNGLGKEQAIEIWQVYRNELLSLPSEQILDSLSKDPNAEYSIYYENALKDELDDNEQWQLFPLESPRVPQEHIRVLGYKGLSKFYDNYPLSALTPKAAQAYLDLCFENLSDEDLNTVQKALRNLGNADWAYLDLCLENFTSDGVLYCTQRRTFNLYDISENKELLSAIETLLTASQQSGPAKWDGCRALISVDLGWQNETGESYENVHISRMYVPLTDEQVHAILACL